MTTSTCDECSVPYPTSKQHLPPHCVPRGRYTPHSSGCLHRVSTSTTTPPPSPCQDCRHANGQHGVTSWVAAQIPLRLSRLSTSPGLFYRKQISSTTYSLNTSLPHSASLAH
ncbi:uncharacterized protein LOC123509887 [Portunus trituberculatus]|uniref:uncharacterized protein LOC123509887 n=1 Tax=Portunus trituberculatus TaxID=210409 RepID=UPI001E1D061B|nr:uncharacterized protein LOC123509887 [Portunus trituberculatus]